MNRESNNKKLFDRMTEELSSSLVADALDGVGIDGQCMRHDLCPIYADTKLVGRAFPVLMGNIIDESRAESVGMREVVDLEVGPGDVIVIGCNQSKRGSIWAEMMSLGARNRGVRGVIADGLVRDIPEMTEMKFPVFATGSTPYSALNRMHVVEFGRYVNCGDTFVKAGDIVFGDSDGVAVIPAEREDEVIKLAFEKADKEKVTRAQIIAGGLLQDIYD